MTFCEVFLIDERLMHLLRCRIVLRRAGVLVQPLLSTQRPSWVSPFQFKRWLAQGALQLQIYGP